MKSSPTENDAILHDPTTISSPLPPKIIVGYANWNQCDDKIIQAVKDGVNVVIWFSINLSTDQNTEGHPPIITNGPDMDCVAEKVRIIRDELKLPCVHLISIGGWNSPHPDTTHSADVMFQAWHHWNRHHIARPEKGFHGFDGIDWDIEGNDTPSSPYNTFSVPCLDLMGRFSQLAKATGYLVAMAPAESYLDPSIPLFDRSLLHEYEEWKGHIPTFAYHGRNVYAYLLARYGVTSLAASDHNTIPLEVETFDFITIQFYEGYSHLLYRLSHGNQEVEEEVERVVRRLVDGWSLNFSVDSELDYPTEELIRIAPERLVIGLANGWAGDGKFLLLSTDQIESVYQHLIKKNMSIRGFAFWNILDEGQTSKQFPNQPVFMARGLNRFLNIRPKEITSEVSVAREEL
eukprot:gene3052-3331_t